MAGRGAALAADLSVGRTTGSAMIDAGYFSKAVEPTPPGLDLPGVREICSVSRCFSEAPEGWLERWAHNSYGWFNSIKDAWEAVPEGRRGAFRLFAYRIAALRFRGGVAERTTVPQDVHPDPIPPSFVSLGYDAVSKFMDSVIEFECSPLSCNAMAPEFAVNEFCLLATEEAAMAAAKRFSVEQPEPGDYYVVEVLQPSRG